MYFSSRQCYHSPTAIYAIGDVIYYGADRSNISKFKGDLVINLTPIPNVPDSIMQIPELAKYIDVSYKEIMIPWPDMEIPCVKPEFWTALQKYAQKKKFKTVCFHCQAGHGRTGTALAAMLVANAKFSAVEAVDFVREEYCEEAVESFDQTAYLKELDIFFNKNTPSQHPYEEPIPSMLLEDMDDTSSDSEEADEEEYECDDDSESDDDEEKRKIFD